MPNRRALTRYLPYGLVLSSFLLNGCILRIRDQENPASARDDHHPGSTAANSSPNVGTTGAPNTGGQGSHVPGCTLPSTQSSGAPNSVPSSSTGSGSTSTEVESTNTDPFARLDAYVDRYVSNFLAQDEFARMRGEVLVSHREQAVSQHSYREMPGQRYSYGSITKTMTAVAVLQLEHAGKLKRSDKLRTFLPELPDSFDAITLEQLLTHRSGLGDFLQDEDMLEKISIEHTREDMIARIAKAPPKFTPGSDIAYSNSGYYLLGIVIERASNALLADYFQSHIFGPAKMTDSNLWDDNIAAGHTSDQGKVILTPRLHPTLSFSAGAAAGTTADLARFSQALVNGTLLPKALLQEMIVPQGQLGQLSMGLGILVLSNFQGQTLIGHNGKTLGHRSAWFTTVDGNWSSVILSNMAVVNSDKIAFDTLEMALTGTYIEPPVAKKTLPFDPNIAKRMAGTYALDPATLPELEKVLPPDVIESVKSLSWHGDTQYLLKPVGQGAFEVSQVDVDEFYNQDAQITVHVQRRGETVQGLFLVQAGLVLKYLKQP